MARVCWWHKATCLVIGHNWLILAWTGRAIWLAHASATTGTICICRRCRLYVDELGHDVDRNNLEEHLRKVTTCLICGAYGDMPCDAGLHS
jgi:hypothetical protein